MKSRIQLLSFFFFQNQTYSKAIQWILELHYGVKTLHILSVEEKIKQWGNKHIVLLINFSRYSDLIFNRDLGGENQGILQNLIRLYCARILEICNIHCSSPCSCLQYTGVCDLFFFCFFHSFIGCSSSDIQYKFVIQHTHTHKKKQLPGFENGFERHFYNFTSTLQIFIFFELIEGHTFSVPVNSLKQGIM